MVNAKKIVYILLILSFLLLPQLGSILEGNDEVIIDISPDGQLRKDETENPTTRGGVRAGNNFEITSSTPVSMPQVDGLWNQSNFGSGPNQNIWNNVSKFNHSQNINYSTVDGHIELDKGGSLFEAWSELDPGPTTRNRHEMAWAGSRGVFYVFGGGVTWSTYTNELWEYNPSTGVWKQVGKTGPPPARVYHVLVWDSVNDLLWLYGGRDQNFDRLNDLWEYNPGNDQWTKKADGPGARSESVGVFNPNTSEIIIYGGYSGSFQSLEKDVTFYNTTTHLWLNQRDYTPRYNHEAVWNPKTNSMLMYGGYNGTTYTTYLSEYFPHNDTWTNHSGIGRRSHPIMAWDTLSEKMILYAGTSTQAHNDTWHYDVETSVWEQKKSIPKDPEDYSEGDWDDINNRLIIYGGGWSTIIDEVWAYYPQTLGNYQTGELVSSVYDPGHIMNLKTISYNLQKPIPEQVGNIPARIQAAGSMDSHADCESFVGPNGKANSYFTIETGQSVSGALDKCRYLAFKINLTSSNRLFTPKFNWLQIDYFSYPDEYTFESEIFSVETQFGLPLRYVNWTSTEPVDTMIEIYFRQSHSHTVLSASSWEKVEKEQNEFGYKTGAYFQYKAVLSTNEPGDTPVLETITFTFNEFPVSPTLKSPLNGTWLGVSKPSLEWQFIDLDESDYQTAFELNIGYDDDAKTVIYTNIFETSNENIELDEVLVDGTYFWELRTRDNYGSWGEWSEPSIFHIDTTKPQVPLINCYSHPLANVWYINNRAVFEWNEPYDASGVAGFNYLLSTSSTAEPKKNVTMTIEEFNLKHKSVEFSGLVIEDDIAEGIWYFHVIAVDMLGYWSDKATITLKIDTEPAQIKDLTPRTVNAGNKFDFNFNISDNSSGIDLVTISWKYKSEIDFRYDQLIQDTTTGNYLMSHQLELNSEPYIEYFVEVTDKAEPTPGNELKYPSAGNNQIKILDNIKPIIEDYPGDIVQNLYTDLVITVNVTDNTGVSDVKIFFNDNFNGMTMSKGADNAYTYKIERLEYSKLSGYAGENLILYKIKATDYFNNTVQIPESGTFNITLKDLEIGGSKDKDSDEKGFAEEFLINIIAIVIIVIVVAIILFIFIRKQSKKMEEDRHKLRMATIDAQETAKAGGIIPPTGISGAPEIPSLEGTISYDSGALVDGAAQLPPAGGMPLETASGPTPSIGEQTAPMSYLPEPETQDYKQAGLMVDDTKPEPKQVSPEKPSGEDDKKKGAKVKVDEDLFISLPKD